jgi:Na+/melibiose symporter-like transporter
VALTAPLRRRDFRLLWTGMAVSLLGDGIFLVAVAWEAYNISDRPAALAYIGLATSVPQVALLLLGGAVSDRVSRRTVLFWADAVRALALLALTAVVAAGAAQLWQLCLVGAVIGVATAFASPAFDSLVPQLVPEDELTQANAIDQSVRSTAMQLAGPALGGIAVAVLQPSGAFGLDAASFAFSAWCVRRMTPPPELRPARSSVRHDVFEGLRYVRSRVWLWGSFAAATFTYLLFLGPTQVLLPYLIRNSLHQGASAYGVVLAIGGLGAVLGAVFSGRRLEPKRPMVWIYGWWTVATLAVAGYGLATSTWGLAAAALVVNGAEAVGAVAWGALKQRRVVNEMLGRVSSVDWCISTALLPLSYALTAPVAEALGARRTLVLAGVLGAAVTLGFLFIPGMQAAEDAPTPLVPVQTR